ncbi:M10 family metallopeptidase C-terminal domain-containing protein [Pseudomonas sp. BW7P1]|uniref:M10 family metallopeptidase C-terminal domain-containing protein n=1 Tax=Pseudomonas sp. BW7P1 TaxID=2973088 RepID=UPI0021ADA055|nr:matrixin family metalloprotease [Pseudomonas sp. BW7P1]UWI61031.1 calcium-binding protein [Pseudomonas sp. BW7P1]
MPTPKTYSLSLPASLTGNAKVDSIISGTYWFGSNWKPLGPTNLSYSFMAPGTSYFAINYSPDNEYNALYELTQGQKTAAINALNTWSAVANLNFTLTSDTLNNVGDLRFGGYRLMDDKTAAWAYFPANSPAGGDVWIGPQTNDPNPSKGTYDFLTFVHEIGHALGLKHPFDFSATNSTLLDPSLDDVHFTVMSYNSNYSYQPTTPMVLDIVAIQSLYGVNMLWQTGDNVYKWDANQSIFETIWDAGGNDTIDASNQLAAVSIDLNEGAYSQIGKSFTNLNNQTAINNGLAIAYGAKIENAIGSQFNDSLVGNALNNSLYGGAGADTMDGGDGSDIYYVDNIGDVVTETSTSLSDTDWVFSSVDFTLGANIENLTLTDSGNLNGTGNDLNNILTGNAGNNILTGNAGNDFLDGKAGADTMIGGDGSDTYYVDNVSDVVIETSTSLTDLDRVYTFIDYTLGANLENILLSGNGNINGTGNELNNRMTGNAGNNVFDGKGGADIMIGNGGSDTYYVDNVGDQVIELEASLTDVDQVFSSIDYTLGTNVENLTLLGSANLNGNGNELNNVLTGNAGNNILTGNAGNDFLDGKAGADTMIGGDGSDTYYVDNIGDVVIETSTSLTDLDRVFTSIDYTLGANLENILLSGNGNINGTGNELNNRMTGNAGDNVFDGKGGADIMIGNGGSDTYYVDNVGDQVIELEASLTDIDRVFSSIDYTLATNVENLALLGNANLNGNGNELNNVLTGNAGNNFLDGKAGADTMIGGDGSDTYYVDNIGDVVIETSTSLTDLDRVFTSIDYTLGANLENILLSGNGNINGTGNELNNRMTGNAGNNVFDGKGGADIMIGNGGSDTYYVDNVGDQVIELEASLTDVDQVFSSIDYTLGTNVENLTLLGSANLNGNGNELNNVLTGNAGNNILTGNAGNDFLDGKAGADTMIGGDGSDTYYVDNIGDVVIETSTSLTDLDRVYTFIDYTLGANLENILLSGNGNINGTGNELNNRMTGNAGDNVFDGKGGADIMIGNGGSDTYYVDNVGDQVIELEASLTDIDRVFSSIDYTLATNVENLALLGNANLNGNGNELNNVLTGNAGNNFLDGKAGADTMIGGDGSDTYYVDNIGDVVIETSTSLTDLDRVFTSIDYTLGANLENILLSGNGNINGTGNELNNRMTGNAGNNVFDGKGGADIMIGNGGSDTYYVDNVGDQVIELEASLTDVDQVFSSIDYTLGTNVENLTLLGSANLNGNGNELNNVLTGNAGNNILTGNAGNDFLDGKAGADTMIGGDGSDTYYVDNIGDVVIETSTSLTDLDRVFTSIDYTLGANLENILLSGNGNINGTGNELNNRMTGNAGDNVFDGKGGADIMIGNGGSDTYYVDNVGDQVIELEASLTDIDRVFSSIDYTLATNVENLALLGNANLNGNGNELNNVLTGNAGNNFLDGKAGADTMIGGDGSDTYYVDNIGDVVIETSTSLTDLDRVFTSIDYTLGANLENIILTGNANINGVGNELNNRMTGNAGNNQLNGGDGNDTLIGGFGVDTMTGGNGADVFMYSTWSETGVGSLRDIITDFSSLQGDKIDLRMFDANLQQSGLNSFSFIGSAQFTGAGQLRFVDHVLSGNVSGNAGADFEIQLVGVNSFSANDLVA